MRPLKLTKTGEESYSLTSSDAGRPIALKKDWELIRCDLADITISTTVARDEVFKPDHPTFRPQTYTFSARARAREYAIGLFDPDGGEADFVSGPIGVLINATEEFPFADGRINVFQGWLRDNDGDWLNESSEDRCRLILQLWTTFDQLQRILTDIRSHRFTHGYISFHVQVFAEETFGNLNTKAYLPRGKVARASLDELTLSTESSLSPPPASLASTRTAPVLEAIREQTAAMKRALSWLAAGLIAAAFIL